MLNGAECMLNCAKLVLKIYLVKSMSGAESVLNCA